MKLSIWQQFSSNHSAEFTVVGRFKTAQEAHKAANELRQLINEVHKLHRSFHEKYSNHARDAIFSGAEIYSAPNGLTPPEFAISERYNVAWDSGAIDWLWGDYDIAELIKTIGADVFIMSNSYESLWYPTTLLTLLAKMGARSIYSERFDDMRGFLTRITVGFEFVTPSSKVANEITSIIVSILDWLQMSANIPLNQQSVKPNSPWILKTDQNMAEDYELEGGFKSSVMLEKQKVRFHVQFNRVGSGLPAMVSWLERIGCTDIHYKLSEDQEIHPSD